MPSVKTTRGRPKGTGLDDRALLQSVIQLVEANPNLKPTTAIKSIGVKDPSAIRRLRDKFHLVHGHSVAKPLQLSNSDARPARAMALKSVDGHVRTAPAQIKDATALPVHRVAAAVSESSSSQIKRPAAKVGNPAGMTEAPDWFLSWAELGLITMAASLNAQWIIYDNVVRSPAVTAAFGGHAALTGFAAIWCATSPDPGKTIH